MINIKKLKADAEEFNLTEFARTTINLETEIPEINNMNIASTSQSIKISKLPNNIISDSITYNDKIPRNNDIILTDGFANNDIILTDGLEINNDIILTDGLEINNDIISTDDLGINDELLIKDNCSQKIIMDTDVSGLLLNQMNNYDPSESILEDLGEYEYIDIKKKTEYNINSKQKIVSNSHK